MPSEYGKSSWLQTFTLFPNIEALKQLNFGTFTTKEELLDYYENFDCSRPKSRGKTGHWSMNVGRSIYYIVWHEAAIEELIANGLNIWGYTYLEYTSLAVAIIDGTKLSGSAGDGTRTVAQYLIKTHVRFSDLKRVVDYDGISGDGNLPALAILEKQTERLHYTWKYTQPAPLQRGLTTYSLMK
ncbi:hypothetical protein BBP40_002918 [Aspergillus hancockii]|nr:hypothetical protein BBP40_002918 [Aspergillus hancockii]